MYVSMCAEMLMYMRVGLHGVLMYVYVRMSEYVYVSILKCVCTNVRYVS